MNPGRFLKKPCIALKRVNGKTVVFETGKFRVIDTGSLERTVLFDLSESEADMVVEFLNEQENGPYWENISDRLSWQDSNYPGLSPLTETTLVHAGYTFVYKPLNLVIEEGKLRVKQ